MFRFTITWLTVLSATTITTFIINKASMRVLSENLQDTTPPTFLLLQVTLLLIPRSLAAPAQIGFLGMTTREPDGPWPGKISLGLTMMIDLFPNMDKLALVTAELLTVKQTLGVHLMVPAISSLPDMTNGSDNTSIPHGNWEEVPGR